MLVNISGTKRVGRRKEMAAWVAPAIAAGASLLGGALGDKSASKDAARARRMSKHQFDQQMDHSIQRRVDDAIRAGVHPLFALGGSVGASPTASVGGQARTGSSTGDALQHVASIIANMPGQKASAKRDESEAALADAQAAKIRSDLMGRGRDSLGTGDVRTFPMPDSEPMGEAVYFKPEIPKSKSRGVVAGTRPGEVDVVMPDGRHVRVYDPDLGLDEIGQIKFAYERSIHYGADAIDWFVRTVKSKIKPQYIREIPKRKYAPKKRSYRPYTTRANYLKDKYLRR